MRIVKSGAVKTILVFALLVFQNAPAEAIPIEVRLKEGVTQGYLSVSVPGGARIAEGASLVGRTDREDYAGIVFPVYSPGEERPKENFLRRDHPPLEQHNGTLKPKGKYLAPPGRANRLLFGPGESADALTDTALPIVLVEGVKKNVGRLATITTQELLSGVSCLWPLGSLGLARHHRQSARCGRRSSRRERGDSRF